MNTQEIEYAKAKTLAHLMVDAWGFPEEINRLETEKSAMLAALWSIKEGCGEPSKIANDVLNQLYK